MSKRLNRYNVTCDFCKDKSNWSFRDSKDDKVKGVCVKHGRKYGLKR